MTDLNKEGLEAAAAAAYEAHCAVHALSPDRRHFKVAIAEYLAMARAAITAYLAATPAPSEDVREVVEWHRKHAQHLMNSMSVGDDGANRELSRSADTHERFAALISSLAAERDRWLHEAKILDADYDATMQANAVEKMELKDRAEALEAEAGRLTEALSEIENIDLQWADGIDSNVERIKSIARAALRRGRDA